MTLAAALVDVTALRRPLIVAAFVAAFGTRVPAADVAAAPQQPTPSDSLALTVLVYDYARVDAETLAEAKRLAESVYRDIGIDLVWRHVSTTTRVASEPPDSLSVAMIIPASFMVDSRVDESVMGVAPRDEGRARVFYVFQTRIETIARRYHVDVARLLGEIVAHEIGHVLLPPQAHAEEGLMRGDWNDRYVRRAFDGALRLTPAQAESIRRSLANDGGAARLADER